MGAARILIVDDDPAVRQIIAALLKRDGVTADIAENGEEAIAMLRKETYDTVVLDLLMPRVDGRGVIAFMKEEGIATPVIVLSAVSDDHDLDPEIVRVAMQKPLDPRELRLVVAAVVEKTR
jgi:DNA-binding response OmpR family regulator